MCGVQYVYVPSSGKGLDDALCSADMPWHKDDDGVFSYGLGFRRQDRSSADDGLDLDERHADSGDHEKSRRTCRSANHENWRNPCFSVHA